MSDATRPDGAGGRLARNLALYTLARLLMVVALTAVIVGVAKLVQVDVPLIVAALFALLIAMPLSMTLLKGLRTKVNQDIAAVDAKRRKDKEALRSRLRGDDA